MTTRVTEGASPRFSRLAAFAAQRSRGRALPLLNLKKKRDCSQSSLEQTSLNVLRPPATCNVDYAIYTTGIPVSDAISSTTAQSWNKSLAHIEQLYRSGCPGPYLWTFTAVSVTQEAITEFKKLSLSKRD